MTDISIQISNGGLSLADKADIATIGAGITAILAIIIATLQYIAASRAQSHAHLHSIFRDYLAIRMQAPQPDKAKGVPEQRNDANVIGYRYYAMEEACHWISKHRWYRPILFMAPSERAAWLATVEHHIRPDLGGDGQDYYTRNRKIFGKTFRQFCNEVFDLEDEASDLHWYQTQGHRRKQRAKRRTARDAEPTVASVAAQTPAAAPAAAPAPVETPTPAHTPAKPRNS